jgi:hypothetical protein
MTAPPLPLQYNLGCDKNHAWFTQHVDGFNTACLEKSTNE